ncbi:MAG: aspartate aminotransferase family protein [Cytophagales bacterium]|nr:MAG: aspartate aminotransferase family protein [Cytophagales bacterium]TAF60686.1 MAG: aspartate aminotransferase family protein [Cytophagales bacterium]
MRQAFLQYLAQTSDFPLMLEINRAKGVYLFGRGGKKYIDLISGIAVSNLGHGQQQIQNAIRHQIRKYSHLMVYGEFVQSPQIKLAKALIKSLPQSFEQVFFVNSGSEAIEGALKLAKRSTKRSKLVAFKDSYHGSSHGALSICGNDDFKKAFEPLLPHVHIHAYGDLTVIPHIDTHTAAVVVEPIQAESGVRLPPEGFLEALRTRCNETGALLIFDEVQTGFGRTGKLWGMEHSNVLPDIVVMAKAMGGGMPLGGFAASSKLMALFKNDPILGHITTQGGHPVSCAAALTALDLLQKEAFFTDAERKAELFKSLLVHPKIKDIRYKGLMMAVEFESFEVLKAIIDKAIEKGVLTDWFLFCNNSMRIAPPLIISDSEIKKCCKILNEAITEVLG